VPPGRALLPEIVDRVRLLAFMGEAPEQSEDWDTPLSPAV
jgi:hypothetical protein